MLLPFWDRRVLGPSVDIHWAIFNAHDYARDKFYKFKLIRNAPRPDFGHSCDTVRSTRLKQIILQTCPKKVNREDHGLGNNNMAVSSSQIIEVYTRLLTSN